MGMVAKNWNGPSIEARINRAAGRAIVGIGMAVAVETKVVTHVVSGNLRRSVHAAPVRYTDAEADVRNVEVGYADLMLLYGPPPPTYTKLGPAIEVGSWLPYACVEWVGRMHPGVTLGLEAVRGMRADRIVYTAFKAEGLV
jgi:hypothetical protein